jgi:hypothetical protein
MLGFLLNLDDDLFELLFRDPLPLASSKPLLITLLTIFNNCLLIGCEVEPLLDYSLPVVKLICIYLEVINNLFG